MNINQYKWNPETDLLGRGAFAEVYKATDNNENPVALKIYTEAVAKGSTGGALNNKYSLEKEFAKGKDLSHTNVIRYIGMDYLEHVNHLHLKVSYPVLIMEFADAGTLEDRIKKAYPAAHGSELTAQAFTADETLSIGREILKGLAYLHEQDIIHRDLKPANILFKTDRKNHRSAKITDFGISRDLLDQGNATQSTTTGIGTINYMAPEQFLPKTYGINGAISNRTDLWAWGTIFYRMITGRLPFTGGDYEDIRKQILEKEPDYSIVPDKYRAIIKGCLEKNASKRFADADAVLLALNAPPPQHKLDPKPIPVPVPKQVYWIAGFIFLVFAVLLWRWHAGGHIDTSGADSLKADSLRIDSVKKANAAANAYNSTSYFFHDNFSNNLNFWPVGDDTAKNVTVEGGGLRIEGLKSQYSYTTTKSLNINTSQDFDMIANVRWIRGVEDSGFGIDFCGNSQSVSYWNFSIAADGHYKIEYIENNSKWQDLVAWTASAVVNKDQASNKLEVNKTGTQISFYINDTRVSTLTFNHGYGTSFGFRSFADQTVECTEFTVTGTKL